jgi:hypothetical protein
MECVKNQRLVRASPAERSGPEPAARIEIVERCSPTDIVVYWRDPTSGRYGEQLWRQTTARRRNICALSGAEIRRGDPVYRPFARGYVPANANWVVLASAVQQIEREFAIPDFAEMG